MEKSLEKENIQLNKTEDLAKKTILEQLCLDDESLKKNDEAQKRLKEVDYFLKRIDKEDFMIGQCLHMGRNFFKGLEENPPLLSLVREKLRDKIIVDLGCGEPNYTNVLFDDLKIPIKAYIGIDIKEFEPRAVKREKERTTDFETEYIQEDMLRFLAKLPDNSVNFFLSAVDSDVLRNKRYRELLRRQIERTTEKNGIIMTRLVEGDMIPGFKTIEEDAGGSSFQFHSPSSFSESIILEKSDEKEKESQIKAKQVLL